MIVYSQKVIQFIAEIKSAVHHILSREVGLKVVRERFYNKDQTHSYPIRIVIYNHKSMLGYFDSSFYELGFHECLMHFRKDLHHIIRHELGHYLTYMTYGNVLPHGPEFQNVCRQLGWGEEISRSTTCLEGAENLEEISNQGIFRKVQKLMALATSSNPHEAEQAMIKSQQLLLKHNMDLPQGYTEEGEKMCLKRILKQKKENAKMRSIARILETFFVNCVYTRSQDSIYLEILGSQVNVEIAEYVAGVLDEELEKLWNQAQRQADLRGLVAKNSFFLGIAKGYCNKIEALKRDYESPMTHALMVIEKKLVDAKAMVYPRLSQSKSQGSYCPTSSQLGEKMGQKLTIHSAVQRQENGIKCLIS